MSRGHLLMLPDYRGAALRHRCHGGSLRRKQFASVSALQPDQQLALASSNEEHKSHHVSYGLIL